MKVFRFLLVVVFSTTFFIGCKTASKTTSLPEKENYVATHFIKREVRIKMRDGVRLFTSIYMPKDTTKTYPIIMQRTPYSCRPYGENKFKTQISPNQFMMKEGYIVVYQDVRGRWMSEGVYDNMRAIKPNKKGKETDESTDTYDTIDWLVKNIPNNNGKVGTWGISYPGHYATVSTIDAHPALKAASPQACIADFFFDDFHHNGAFLLSYFRAISLFGTYKDQPTDQPWYEFPDMKTQDQYDFFLKHTPLKKLDPYFEHGKISKKTNTVDDYFWKEIINHPNYDSVWQSKNIIPHLKNIKPSVATMFVGGFFDAEDLYGPLASYKMIESNNPKNYNTIVFGPWDHGGWARKKVKNSVGNYYFGDSISIFFQKEVESKFFRHFLKGNGSKDSGLPEVLVFDTGKKQWKSYATWPPKETLKSELYLSDNQKLTEKATRVSALKFTSDLKHPVPYSEDIKTVFTPRKYMTDDQRFAARRPDVLTFETPVLSEDITMVGDLMAKLQVATTGTDADWIVKIIDVHPNDAPENNPDMQNHLKMSNYHLMVRSEVMRGRFRESFENPIPFVSNQKTAVNFTLQDVFHTFKKEHKIQVQIQSTWFPLIDLNPQTFVDNIYKANESDFKNQVHTVFTDSKIEFRVLKR